MPYQAVGSTESLLILTNAGIEREFAIFGRNSVKSQTKLDIVISGAVGRILPAVADTDLPTI